MGVTIFSTGGNSAQYRILRSYMLLLNCPFLCALNKIDRAVSFMQWSGPFLGLNPNAHSPPSLPGVGPPVPFPLSREFGCSPDTPPAPAPQTTGTRLLYPTLTPLMGEREEGHEVHCKPT